MDAISLLLGILQHVQVGAAAQRAFESEVAAHIDELLPSLEEQAP
jgi:hypothetical protein